MTRTVLIFSFLQKVPKITKKHKSAKQTGQKLPKSAKKIHAKKGGFHSIGATIRNGREIQCLPYVGFFK